MMSGAKAAVAGGDTTRSGDEVGVCVVLGGVLVVKNGGNGGGLGLGVGGDGGAEDALSNSTSMKGFAGITYPPLAACAGEPSVTGLTSYGVGDGGGLILVGDGGDDAGCSSALSSASWASAPEPLPARAGLPVSVGLGGVVLAAGCAVLPGGDGGGGVPGGGDRGGAGLPDAVAATLGCPMGVALIA